MSRKRLNGRGPDIIGFWNREGSFGGKLGKRIMSGEVAWYTVQITELNATKGRGVKAKAVDREKGDIAMAVGDFIGVSESSNLVCLKDLKVGTPVWFSSNGKKTNPRNGREFWDIEVDADTEEVNPLPF